jgi:L-lactate utilization protein LutC
MDWAKLADDDTLQRTAKALGGRGIEAIITSNREEAKKKVMELLPEGAEVMEASSTTLAEMSVSKEIQESGRYVSVKKKITSTSNEEERHAARRASLSSDYMIGSVHAVTEEGQIVIASNSGSQLAPYAYGAANVIWVVGTQKIVKNLEDAFLRIKEYVFPLEDARMRKTYGIGSNISKILIFEKEVAPKRIKLVFVKEKLGF